MDKTTTLIFPLDIDEADTFIRVAHALGLATVGASSSMAVDLHLKLTHQP